MSLIQVTNVGELLEGILRYMDVLTLLRMKLVCKRYYVWVGRCWSIVELLSRFVPSPRSFLWMMRASGALVAGGLATQYFDRRCWAESDMDIFVKEGGSSVSMLEYMQQCGYVLDTEDTSGSQVDVGRSVVFKLRRGLKVVQVICTEDGPLETVVTRFYSTVTVCVLTSFAGYCVYPRSTFVERKMYPFGRLSVREQVQGLKYEQRGWVRSRDSDEPPDEVSVARKVNDKYTWCIPHFEEADAENVAAVGRARFAVGKSSVVLLREEKRSWAWLPDDNE